MIQPAMEACTKIYPIIADISLIESDGEYFIQNLQQKRQKLHLCHSRCDMVHLKCWSALKPFIKECVDQVSCFDDLQNFVKISYAMPELYTCITISREDAGLFLTLEDGNSFYYSPRISINLKEMDIFCDTIYIYRYYLRMLDLMASVEVEQSNIKHGSLHI